MAVQFAIKVKQLFFATTVFLFAFNVQSMPIEYVGVDAAFETTQSDLAFSQWSSAVGDHTLDNLDGLAGSPGFGGTLTSDLGNTFSTGDDLMSVQNFSFAVLEETSLRLTKSTEENADDVTSFTWSLTEAVDAFGFYARGNDGGTVTIVLNDGSLQEFSLSAAVSNSRGDNLFWGVSNLASAILSVTITSTDPTTANTNTNNSNWDRFVYRTAANIPEPGSFALLLIGLAGITLGRRRTCS